MQCQMGTLNVYQRFTRDPKPDQTQRKVWSLSTDQGKKWKCKIVKIPSSRQFSVVFESVRGNGYQSDVAVDDIRFIHCAQLGPTPGPTPQPKPSLLDEDFENCTSCWKNENDGHDQIDWIIGRGETASLNTGPSYDHTKKTVSGRYLYIDVSSASHISGWVHADLESRLMVVQRRCYMTFWYHMYGSGVGSLWVVAYVYKDPSNLADWQQVDLWGLWGNRGNKWTQGMVSLYNLHTANQTTRIVFSGLRGSDYSGDIAIDDIKFHNCDFKDTITPCSKKFAKCNDQPFTRPTLGPTSGDCTFEHGSCHWNNTAVSDMPWFLREGKTGSVNTGPSVDHTTGTSSGYYMHIEASFYTQGSVAILEGPYMLPTPNCQMSFFYHMFGGDCGSLLVYINSGDSVRLVFNKTGEKGDRWIQANIQLNSDYGFRIHIVATRGTSYKGDIAIDDIKFQGQCTFTDDAALKYGDKALTTGCSDGGREGFFTHPSVAGCKGWWFGRKNLRATPTPGAKCGDDISRWGRPCNKPADVCQSGWHVCGTFGDIFEINNRTTGVDCQKAGYGHFSAGINHCMQNNDGGNGCKRVKTGTEYGCGKYHESCSAPLCCGFGCQGPDLCDSGVFRNATRYSPAPSSLEGCSFISAANAGGVMCCKDDSSTPTQPPTSSPVPGSCDFERGMCDWLVDSTAKLRFSRWRGETPSRNTGPRYDHTKGDATGYYLYMSASRGNPKDTARVSYHFNNASKYCQINFFYYMYGAGLGILRLYLEPDGGARKQVWQRAGNQGDGWYRGAYNFSDLAKNKTAFTISFEGERGPTYASDIAIDDISFTPCSPIKPGQCRRDQFRCQSGQCIPASYLCDTVLDCEDHSDEGSLAQCPNWNCGHFEIYCPATGKCLNKTLQCNNKQDCPDWSDEAHCQCTAEYCINGQCRLDNNERPDCVCYQNYTGRRCENCTNCECKKPGQIQCKVGKWFCADKSDVCSKKPEYCGLSSADFVKLCKSCTQGYCLNGGTCVPVQGGTPRCSCPPNYTGNQCQTLMCPKLQVSCRGSCVNINDVCNKQASCSFAPSEITKYCGDCNSGQDFCSNNGVCIIDKGGFRQCLCPFAFSGRQCKIRKDPNGCTNRVPPLQPCSGTCVSKDVICNRTNTCGYPEIQIKSNCGECFDQYCLHGGTCNKTESQSRLCTCVGRWNGDRCQIQLPPTAGKQKGSQPKSKSSMYIGIGVAAGILLIIVVLVVAYFVMKSKKKKLTLFSVFYDPTNKDASEIRKKGKTGQIEMAEGVGNPVYDTFNEGQPLEDFHMSDVDTNMFATDDTFGISSEKGGATSMANPLYQDPYLEEDLTKY